MTEFAAQLHFDRGHISKIETGKRLPSVPFARACDQVLGSSGVFAAMAAAIDSAVRTRPSWVRPAQLPAAQRNFVGRHNHLRRLGELLRRDARSVAVPVAVIDGAPGVGKSALAVQWARRAVDGGLFRDGQLYVDLRGHSDQPSPVEIIDDLLRALGVPSGRIPIEPEQKSAVVRSLLDGRDVLIVLDNATNTRQVQSLLPGSPSCAVLITSRLRLSGLTSTVGAVTLTLPELTEPEAIRLLRSIIGAQRADADRAAVATVARRCGRLPLALVLAAEHIATRRHRSAAQLAVELKADRALLDLAAGDIGLRAAFDASYRMLDSPTAQLFRFLGRHPGQAIDARIAAAIAHTTLDNARSLLDQLAATSLLQCHGEDSYHLHDLHRAYATELGTQMDAAS